MIELNLLPPERREKKSLRAPLVATVTLAVTAAVGLVITKVGANTTPTNQSPEVTGVSQAGEPENNAASAAALAKLDAKIKYYYEGRKAHIEWEEQNPDQVEEQRSTRESWETGLRDERSKREAFQNLLTLERQRNLENRQLVAELESSRTHTTEALLAGLALTIGGIVGGYKLGSKRRRTSDEPLQDFDDPDAPVSHLSTFEIDVEGSEGVEESGKVIPTVILDEEEIEVMEIEDKSEDEDEQEDYDAARTFMDKEADDEEGTPPAGTFMDKKDEEDDDLPPPQTFLDKKRR